ncbi:MAG: helix-turn-helix transcriptional regulator, partial [Clostridia bacterium]|nr:helix-turn-helix transcriptional regulator [Clostridia bacterium]
MYNLYVSFKTSLPIPIRVNFSATNKFEDVSLLHSSRDITVARAFSKYSLPNRLSFIEIIYCHEGEFNYNVDGKQYFINQGECIVIGRQKVRCGDITCNNYHAVYTVGFSHDFCKSIGIDDSITCHIKDEDNFFKTNIIALIKEIDKKSPDWTDNCLNISKSLLYQLNDNYSDYSTPINDKNQLSDERMEILNKYMLYNMDKKITSVDMANLLGLKSSQFNAAFKSTTGITPIEYLNFQRCRVARALMLTTDFDFDEIIELCGYSERAYFYKVYRKIFGEEPFEV